MARLRDLEVCNEARKILARMMNKVTKKFLALIQTLKKVCRVLNLLKQILRQNLAKNFSSKIGLIIFYR